MFGRVKATCSQERLRRCLDPPSARRLSGGIGTRGVPIVSSIASGGSNTGLGLKEEGRTGAGALRRRGVWRVVEGGDG